MQRTNYARRDGLISAIPLGSLSTSTKTCREVSIFERISGNYSTAKQSFYCVDGRKAGGLVSKFSSLTRWVFAGFMKKKTKPDPMIRNIRIEPSTKQSITRMLHAWARSKKLEIKQIEKVP